MSRFLFSCLSAATLATVIYANANGNVAGVLSPIHDDEVATAVKNEHDQDQVGIDGWSDDWSNDDWTKDDDWSNSHVLVKHKRKNGPHKRKNDIWGGQGNGKHQGQGKGKNEWGADQWQQCNYGFVFLHGKCQCPGELTSVFGKCGCKDQNSYQDYKSCHCKHGFKFDHASKKCLCPPGQYEKHGECVCPKNEEKHGYQCKCKPGFHLGKHNNCECKTPYVEQHGSCVCPKGFIVTKNGCQCPAGSEYNHQHNECNCLDNLKFNYRTRQCECPHDQVLVGHKCLPKPKHFSGIGWVKLDDQWSPDHSSSSKYDDWIPNQDPWSSSSDIWSKPHRGKNKLPYQDHWNKNNGKGKHGGKGKSPHKSPHKWSSSDPWSESSWSSTPWSESSWSPSSTPWSEPSWSPTSTPWSEPPSWSPTETPWSSDTWSETPWSDDTWAETPWIQEE